MTVVLKCSSSKNSLEAGVVINLLEEELISAGADIRDLLLLHGEFAKLLILIVVVSGRLLDSPLAPLAWGTIDSLRGSGALAGLGGLGGLGSVRSRLLGGGGS